MLFSVFVVESNVLLQAVCNVLVTDDNLSFRSVAENVKDVEQFAGIASAESEQCFGLDHLDAPLLKNRIGSDGPIEQLLQIRRLHRFEDIDLATRK